MSNLTRIYCNYRWIQKRTFHQIPNFPSGSPCLLALLSKMKTNRRKGLFWAKLGRRRIVGVGKARKRPILLDDTPCALSPNSDSKTSLKSPLEMPCRYSRSKYLSTSSVRFREQNQVKAIQPTEGVTGQRYICMLTSMKSQ